MGQAFSLLRDHARVRNLRLSGLAQAFVDGSEPLTSLTASTTQQQLPGAARSHHQSSPGQPAE